MPKAYKLAVALIVLLTIPIAGRAQTPDGMTPPNEGVCDDLTWATPGLYVVCIGSCAREGASRLASGARASRTQIPAQVRVDQ
jgi:hypothetical protein